MRSVKSLYFLALVVFVATTGYAQQLPISNFQLRNTYPFNPAYAGFNNSLEGALSHRQQWTGVDNAPVTTFLGVHGLLGTKHGVGGSIVVDQTDFISRLNARLSYGYKVEIGEDHALRFGLAAGILQNKISTGDIRITDPNDALLFSEDLTGIAFDADFGIFYNVKALQIGIAIPRLLESGIDYSPENGEAGFMHNRHFSAQAAYAITTENELWRITPTAFFRGVPAGSTQIDGGIEVAWKNLLWLGAMWRQDAGYVASLGFTLKDRFNVGYAYEFGTSGIAQSSNGSHEVMLGFMLKKKTKDQPKDPAQTDATTPVKARNYSGQFGDGQNDISELTLTDAATGEAVTVTAGDNGNFVLSELEQDKVYQLKTKDATDETLYIYNDKGDKVMAIEPDENGVYNYKALSTETLNSLPVLEEKDTMEVAPKVDYTSVVEKDMPLSNAGSMMLMDVETQSMSKVDFAANGDMVIKDLTPGKNYKLIAPGGEASNSAVYVKNSRDERVLKFDLKEQSQHVFTALTKQELDALPPLAEETPILGEEAVVVVEEPPVIETEDVLPPPPVEVVNMSTDKGYYMVVESQLEAKYAQVKVNELKDKGVSAFIAKRDGSKWYFVAIKKYDTLQEALKFLQETRTDLDQEAWIMVGDKN